MGKETTKNETVFMYLDGRVMMMFSRHDSSPLVSSALPNSLTRQAGFERSLGKRSFQRKRPTEREMKNKQLVPGGKIGLFVREVGLTVSYFLRLALRTGNKHAAVRGCDTVRQGEPRGVST